MPELKKNSINEELIIQKLGDGLVLRRSTAEDAEALFEFNSTIHSDEGPEKPDERVGQWAKDLLRGNHPTFGMGDFTIVEDTKSGKIVSSLNLISQTWSYEGIPFKVGRPEMVGTLPDYRKRGLVRKQFDAIHQWSAERGELVQAITGIPYYYRLFGYEMALDLGGGRSGSKSNLPKLKKGEKEPYTFRKPTEADIPFIQSVYEYGSQRYPIRCVRDHAMYEYELFGRSKKNINRADFRVIEDRAGERVGFLAQPPWNWGSTHAMGLYELKQGVSYGAVTPSVARYIFRTGEKIAKKTKQQDFEFFSFSLTADHPAYQVMKGRLPRRREPYAWYIRVADIPGFLKHIAPALEERLAGSIYAGHSAEIKITFYRNGVRLVLKEWQTGESETLHTQA